MKRVLVPALSALAGLLLQVPCAAARLDSASFKDPGGILAFGSAYTFSPNYEQSGGAQELAVSTQTGNLFSQRSGRLAFSPLPAMISDLSAVIVSSYGVRLTWTAPAADGYRGTEEVLDYLVRFTSSAYIDTDEQFAAASPYAETWVPLEAGGSESRVVEGFNAGTTYYFSIESINSHSLRSEISNRAAAFALVPLAPMNFQLSRTGNSITLTWIPPAGFNNRIAFNDRFSPAYPFEIKGYRVYRATAPADAQWTYLGETSTGTLSWTDIIGAADSYYYHARAFNMAGESLSSYARGTLESGLFFLAPDNASSFLVPQSGAGAFFSSSADPMDVYTIEISTHQEDLQGRVVKSVEFAAYRGGLEADTSLQLETPGTLKLYYAKSGGAIVPSAADARALSMYYFNGSRWLQMYGTVNEAERSVQLQTGLLGRYQLRLTERSGTFSADRAGLSNRLITPNGDGKNDTMVFVVDNPEGKPVAGRIYDLRGALVSSMGQGPVANSLAWDAKSGGQVVPGGVYVYQIECDGNVYNGTVVVVR